MPARQAAPAKAVLSAQSKQENQPSLFLALNSVSQFPMTPALNPLTAELTTTSHAHRSADLRPYIYPHLSRSINGLPALLPALLEVASFCAEPFEGFHFERSYRTQT